MKTSYKRIIEFSRASGDYLKKFPKETKLKYALEKVRERCEPLFNTYNKKLSEIDLKHAKEDTDGCVLFTESSLGVRTYKFSKEGLVAKDAEIEEYFTDPENAEIEPFICTSLPKDLHESWLTPFEGFVLQSLSKEDVGLGSVEQTPTRPISKAKVKALSQKPV
ncbi:hypothetical protein [Dyadobacter sp. CY312]|uniref:hypothetical protein n=1 Tax=Dyadobacter sp. CY312 TaxID=2907303 RepID=UPI001F200E38|nr:hypothetical protein [Dyadobacter sp. CY312]MCE7039000.1 hypothetical protein [Dyadobacter sp. CY312]